VRVGCRDMEGKAIHRRLAAILAADVVGYSRLMGATRIPGARFLPLASRNHLIPEDEPAFPRFLQEIRGFLAK